MGNMETFEFYKWDKFCLNCFDLFCYFILIISFVYLATENSNYIWIYVIVGLPLAFLIFRRNRLYNSIPYTKMIVDEDNRIVKLLGDKTNIKEIPFDDIVKTSVWVYEHLYHSITLRFSCGRLEIKLKNDTIIRVLISDIHKYIEFPLLPYTEIQNTPWYL